MKDIVDHDQGTVRGSKGVQADVAVLRLKRLLQPGPDALGDGGRLNIAAEGMDEDGDRRSEDEAPLHCVRWNRQPDSLRESNLYPNLAP